MEFNILETILNSVALGLGITLVPQSAVHHLSKAGKVHCHAIPEKIRQYFNGFHTPQG